MTAPLTRGWHWPRFEQTLCGDMSDRERLGLPDMFVVGRLEDQIRAAYGALRSVSADRLLQIIASRNRMLAERVAAGNLLALCGDPRIEVDRPAMVNIPGGEVSIGLESGEVTAVLERFAHLGLDRSWIEKECPRHRVQLPGYRIARYPVTNWEYRDFLVDSGHHELPSSWAFRQFPQDRANHPVYTVSADSAGAYAAWLAQRTDRAFRLPTEAEWEWAAAGPAGLEFPWGDRFDAELTNTAESGLFASTTVGVYVGGESPFGVADMAGNVEEYVADDYAAYPGGTLVSDHLLQIHGRYRVARGGSFARFRDLARTRRRHGHNPRSVTYAMGFRLAETV